ncbi:cold-shock protein [Candidatus Latescibacterota bacterium]
MEGKIIKVNRTRGYGFVRSENGEEYFFHHTDLIMTEIVSVNEGDNVAFELDFAPRGLLNVSVTLATNIKIIEY